MTREEFLKGIKYIEESNSSTKIAEHLVHAGEYIKSLEQQNAELPKERANMQATHQSTIESYRKEIAELQARIKELQEPKTCDGCIYWTLGGGCSGNFMIKCNRFPHLVDRFKPKQNNVH